MTKEKIYEYIDSHRSNINPSVLKSLINQIPEGEKLPNIPNDVKWCSMNDLEEGKSALVKMGQKWVIIKGGK